MTDGTNLFDQLNDALFAQMDKLQSIDPKDKEQMEQTIEQTRAVSQLAGNIIANAGNAIKVVQLAGDNGSIMNAAVKTPRMLTGRY